MEHRLKDIRELLAHIKVQQEELRQLKERVRKVLNASSDRVLGIRSTINKTKPK